MNESGENGEQVQHRKSLYQRIAPIIDTYDDVIKNKLESGKFPFTRPGIIKAVAMVRENLRMSEKSSNYIISHQNTPNFTPQSFDVFINFYICLIASLSLFLGTSLCDETSSWYPYLLPSCEGAAFGGLLILYVIFSSGCTTKKPGFWVKIDIMLNLSLAIIGIISNVWSMCDCGKGDFSQVIIGVFGIGGYLVSVIGCISIFLMYRFVDSEKTDQIPSRRPIDPRKSVFA